MSGYLSLLGFRRDPPFRKFRMGRRAYLFLLGQQYTVHLIAGRLLAAVLNSWLYNGLWVRVA